MVHLHEGLVALLEFLDIAPELPLLIRLDIQQLKLVFMWYLKRLVDVLGGDRFLVAF